MKVGTKHSALTRKKMRDAHVGMTGKKHSKQTRKKMSESQKGHPTSLETRMRQSTSAHSRPSASKETRIKMSLSHRGKLSPHWRGGLTPLNKSLRNTAEYELWRNSVFLKDNFTCQVCGKRGGDLEADHLVLFTDLIQENGIKDLAGGLNCKKLWLISHGQTLCKHCHREKTREDVKIIRNRPKQTSTLVL
jgi:5-methylcytosine-specific restriction endonuclease McrA